MAYYELSGEQPARAPHTPCRWSGDQNCSDKQSLHRQSGEDSRIGRQAGMVLHQHSADGAAQSTGKEQLMHPFFHGMRVRCHGLAKEEEYPG